MTNVTVVVGGQFGSEGKGAISAYLTSDYRPTDLAIRVAGPNAGHTVVGEDDGKTWKLRAAPVAAVSNKRCRLHIAAGSEVHPGVLHDEIWALERAGYSVVDRLTVHPSATFLDPGRHPAQEESAGLTSRIGSTGKGIGAARADRIMRRAMTFEEFAANTYQLPAAKGEDNKTWWQTMLGHPDPTDFEDVLIEGTQGYGLGLHTKYYPQVTSSDCRAIDFLAMAGISPWHEDIRTEVIVVARMYPIRVAGNSGPLKDETTWAELGLEEERTTVTNNVRRVGHWDLDLVKEALAANGAGSWNPHVKMALTMLDQRFPKQYGRTDLDDEAEEFVDQLEDELETYIQFVGTGPSTVAER